MGMGAAICHHRERRVHTLKPVPEARRNNRESMTVRSQIHLHKSASSGRGFTVIVNHKLDSAGYACVVQRHFAVFMPAFDDVFVNCGEVYLTELDEMRVRPPKHVEYGATLVGDSPQRNNLNAFDDTVPDQHSHAIGQRSGIAQMIFTSGTGIINLPPVFANSACCLIISSAKFQASNKR